MEGSLRLLTEIASHPKGRTYKELSKNTGLHVNTISRHVTKFYDANIIEIRNKKTNSSRGRKWVNIIRLREEFYKKGLLELFSRIKQSYNSTTNQGV